MIQRRIIYNDDGAAGKVDFNPRCAEGPEGFLAAYFNTAVGTQVDSWFYNVGTGMLHEDGSFLHFGCERRRVPEAVGDDHQVIIDAARKAGMEVFASLRMNDVHEGSNGLFDTLKQSRPDLLLGGDHYPNKYPHLLPDETPVYDGGYPAGTMMDQFWAGFDFAKAPVREHRLKFIREICTRYDWDGIELDFMRMPLLFRLGYERDNIETMNNFMREVRAILDEIKRKRARPYLLAVRVPPTPAMALRTGIDIERWLDERLIHLLIPGTENWYYTPKVKQMIDLGHCYKVPVYPCYGAHLWQPKYDPDVEIHTVTSNFWALGADGVYLYNFAYWDEPVRQNNWLNQIGDPKTLVSFDKCCRPDPGDYIGRSGYCVAPPTLPVKLVFAPPIEIIVGDDVALASRIGLLDALQLKVTVEHLQLVEGICIAVNGERVPAESVRRITDDAFEATLSPSLVTRGINTFEILPGPGCIGRFASAVTDLELWVRYTRHAT